MTLLESRARVCARVRGYPALTLMYTTILAEAPNSHFEHKASYHASPLMYTTIFTEDANTQSD